MASISKERVKLMSLASYVCPQVLKLYRLALNMHIGIIGMLSLGSYVCLQVLNIVSNSIGHAHILMRTDDWGKQPFVKLSADPSSVEPYFKASCGASSEV